MISYWEKQSLLRYDNIIIGGGLVGLNTAIELKTKFPAERVLVLERAALPYGASTRNAGFACMGGFVELMDDSLTMSTDEMANLFARRREGLKKMRKRLGEDVIRYRERGSHELISAEELPLLDKINEINQLLLPVTGQPAFAIANHKLKDFGFDPNKVAAIVEANQDGEIDTGRMMRALHDLALEMKVEVKTGVHVSHFDESEAETYVHINDAVRPETLSLSCKRLFICTNAFAPALLPDVDVQPGRGQVLITKPIENLHLQGIFHYHRGYYYFREIDGRILLGGGRQLDINGESTTEIELRQEIQDDLEHKLTHLILPGKKVEIEMRWAGIMAFGANKRPIVRSFGKNIFGAFRMGGMGVALGTLVAQELVALIEE